MARLVRGLVVVLGGGVRSFCVLGVISALSMYAARVC